MRNRLTAAFVVLSVLLLVGAGVVRSFALRDLIREQESANLQQSVHLAARIIGERVTAGAPIDRTLVSSLAADDSRLVFTARDGERVAAAGTAYDGSAGGHAAGGPGDLIARAPVVAGDGTVAGEVTAAQSGEVVRDILGRDLGALVVLFAMIALVAAAIGYLVSRVMSAPFQQLAVAAAALGRGRFDLDLPRTRVPEARAIAQALRTSARQLQDRMQRERAFAQHASHVLRTPLTGLRLELEDLTLREELPADVRGAAARGLASIDEVDAMTEELVSLSRGATLVQGAELPLVELATQLAQRWSDRLAARGRELTASAEGDLAATYTPGPVEQVLDLVLADVAEHGRGPVRILFWGQEDGHLRVRVSTQPGPDGPAEALGPADADGHERARAAAEALGGRLSHRRDELELLLPRR